MVRLGCYTGKIYGDGTEMKDINECCVMLNSGADEEALAKMKDELHKRCIGCKDCEESKGE